MEWAGYLSLFPIAFILIGISYRIKYLDHTLEKILEEIRKNKSS